MKFNILIKKNKTQPQSIDAQTTSGTSNNRMPEIEELKEEDLASVAGAPQVENDPTIG